MNARSILNERFNSGFKAGLVAGLLMSGFAAVLVWIVKASV